MSLDPAAAAVLAFLCALLGTFAASVLWEWVKR